MKGIFQFQNMSRMSHTLLMATLSLHIIVENIYR